MNLVIIILVAAIIIATVIIANNSKNKADEVPEPLVNPNFGLDIEDPAAPVQPPAEGLVETKSEIFNEGLEKLEEPVVSVKKALKAPAVKKASKSASKPVAKTSAKPAPKKTVVKKTK